MRDIAIRKRKNSLEDHLDRCEIRHDRKVSNIAKKLEGYGYKVETHLEYYNTVSGVVLGEVDILAQDKYGFMNVEVKSNGRGMVKGFEQLQRFKTYFPDLNVINSLLINKTSIYRV